MTAFHLSNSAGLFHKKPRIFLLVFMLGMLSGCGQEDTPANASQDNINMLSIAISDQLWNGEVGDSLRKKFAAPVDGLQQEEPSFTIRQFPLKILDAEKATARNIIIIKKEEKNSFKLAKNQFSNPQNIVYISGNNINEIVAHIESHGDTLVRRFKETEIRKHQELIAASLLDDQKIVKKFNIRLNIPSDYKYVVDEPNFLWIKKEILGGNTSILVYRVPFKTLLKNDDIVGNIIEMRDSFGSQYIKGKKKGTSMITEESYSPYFFNTLLDDKRTYETKGTWELKGDFMSGSFINYAIMDRKKREFIIIEGFCYAPSTAKRDLMHELESIIKSVHFL